VLVLVVAGVLAANARALTAAFDGAGRGGAIATGNGWGGGGRPGDGPLRREPRIGGGDVLLPGDVDDDDLASLLKSVPGGVVVATPLGVAPPPVPPKQQEAPKEEAAAPDAVPPPPPSPPPSPPPKRRLHALWFSMDSLTGYIEAAERGGPAGEIIVRHSLTWALTQLGVEFDIADSDAKFAELTTPSRVGRYDLIFLDPWTAFGEGWKPRAFLPGREARTFIVSFFGMPEAGHGLELDPSHILTPYRTNPDNTFIGFVVDPKWSPRFSHAAHFDGRSGAAPSAHGGDGGAHGVHAEHAAPSPGAPPVIPRKKAQGILWGKAARYFEGKEDLLRSVAAVAPLHTVADLPLAVTGVVHHGHLSRDEWKTLLAESKFMLGVGTLF